MKKILLLILLLIISIGFSQRPEESWTPYGNGPGSEGWGSTAETFEDCYESWIFNISIGNCIQPSMYLCNNYWSPNSSTGIDIQDTYELCCIVAYVAGYSEEDSPCEESINSLNINEYKKDNDSFYHDMYGRKYKDIPKGFSIKNGKKYFKL